MTIVELNQKVDDFTLPATGKQEITLSQLEGKNIVIYFYPKDNTPGCTTEGQNFNDLLEQFTHNNCIILGVSKDSVRKHENFKAKQSFGFDLISDTDETLCQQFDVIKLKKLYGKEYMGIERSTFLFNKQGLLIAEWRKVRVKGHVDDVLNTVESLNS